LPRSVQNGCPVPLLPSRRWNCYTTGLSGSWPGKARPDGTIRFLARKAGPGRTQVHTAWYLTTFDGVTRGSQENGKRPAETRPQEATHAVPHSTSQVVSILGDRKTGPGTRSGYPERFRLQIAIEARRGHHVPMVVVGEESAFRAS
jgi:hypothetical protein